MFSEKSRLVEKRENPFYGSYKENNILEEIHWQNKRKKRQLAMVVVVTMILVVLAIAVALVITLPPLLDARAAAILDPEDPPSLLAPSPSILSQNIKSAVCSDSSICSNIGKDVLQNLNGSAVDAAVAMTLCVGVTNPQSSGLGGGLFMVIFNSTGSAMHAINARETVPSGVNPALYESDPSSSVNGGLAVGIPGEIAGLWEAHQKFGRVAWPDLVKFSQDLALNGFAVSKQLAVSLVQHKEKISGDPTLRSEFINPATGEPWLEGDVMARPRLAVTLETLGAEGVQGFYNGTIAANILRDIQNANGIITAEDLSSYRPIWDTPISYSVTSNLTMYSPPFPSSGPVVALALGILDGFGRKRHEEMTVADIGVDTHRLAEVLKYATSYRSLVADPMYANTTGIEERLLSPVFATELRDKLEEYKTYDDPRQYGAQFSLTEDAGTAHISIIGPDGDAVALTTTINLAFGAGFMGDASGIIFNNELNDFSLGTENDKFGLPGNPDNKIEAGKRPASSMAPLIFLNHNHVPVFATGGSGGLQILPAVISTSWRALYRYMDIKQATDYPRIAPDFYNTRLNYEYGLPKSVVEELKRRGHATHRISDTVENPERYIGSVNSVCRTHTNGMILANADFRRHGEPAGFD
ncbi:Gamma-glutamyltranspeptidase 1 [Orchesella cincta]|uniref:Gamma-glutamyltranspeptidase 1 n=1 Tax=Orchesella cincta TaxID=48709 RepID=A0A1D2NG32_ORCCI|nr:Gamma-glutamyltranspeptidase 1 [Orchesella cincta]